jgi:hypothetical protein
VAPGHANLASHKVCTFPLLLYRSNLQLISLLVIFIFGSFDIGIMAYFFDTISFTITFRQRSIY